MKILMLCPGLPFPIYRDGQTLHAYHLLNQFSKRADCHLISFEDSMLSDQDRQSLEQIASFDAVPIEHENRWCSLVRMALSSKRQYSAEFERVVKARVESLRPDVVIAEQAFMSLYWSAFKSVPCVMSAVDAISLAARRQSAMAESMLMRLAWTYVSMQRLSVEKEYFPKFDRITVVSPEDAEFLTRRIGKSVEVIPSGVDLDYFSPRLRSKRPNSIVFSGNLSAPMNFEACQYLLQKVFPRVNKQFPELRLVIVGRNPPDSIKNTKPKYVEVHENVPDIRESIGDALVYVSPIEYGTGIKSNVLQAMSMGLPVLCTPLIAKPIGIKDGWNGMVAQRGDEFVDTLISAVNKPPFLERIGSTARKYVEDSFSWERIADRYLDTFKEISEDNTEPMV